MRHHARVDRNDGCTFGNTVAFENAYAKAVVPNLLDRWIELFRSGHYCAYVGEIVVVGKARVVAQKSRCTKDSRALAVINHFGDIAVVQRTGVEKCAVSAHQRQNGACRKAKTMK